MTTNAQQAVTPAQPGTAALEKVLQHHARTCTYWLFSGPRACSCGVIAARLELQKIRAELGDYPSRATIGNKSPAYGDRDNGA